MAGAICKFVGALLAMSTGQFLLVLCGHLMWNELSVSRVAVETIGSLLIVLGWHGLFSRKWEAA